MAPALPWWVGNTSATIGFMLLVFCVAWMLLAGDRALRLKKPIELGAIFVAAFGIVGITADVRAFSTVGAIKLYQGWVIGASTPLHYSLTSNYPCFGFVKSELSPPYFDAMAETADQICSWRLEANQAFQKLELVEFPSLPTIVRSGFPEGTDEFFPSLREEHQAAVERYEEFVTEAREIKERSQKTDLEVTWFVLSPLLVAGALAVSAARILREKPNAD